MRGWLIRIKDLIDEKREQRFHQNLTFLEEFNIKHKEDANQKIGFLQI